MQNWNSLLSGGKLILFEGFYFFGCKLILFIVSVSLNSGVSFSTGCEPSPEKFKNTYAVCLVKAEVKRVWYTDS